MRKPTEIKEFPTWAKWSLSLLAIAAISNACAQKPIEKERSTEEKYPGPWVTNSNIEIQKTLVKNSVRGCGQYAYRASSANRGEFLVLCSRDGTNWTAYLTWIYSEKITGPLQPPTDISLPPP